MADDTTNADLQATLTTSIATLAAAAADETGAPSKARDLAEAAERLAYALVALRGQPRERSGKMVAV